MSSKRPLGFRFLELTYQTLFYSSPYIIDLERIVDYLATTFFNGDYKELTVWSVVLSFNLGFLIPFFGYGFLYLTQIPFFEQFRLQDWVWNQQPSKRRTQYLEVVKSTIFSMLANLIGSTFLFSHMLRLALKHTDDQQFIRGWAISTDPFYIHVLKIAFSLIFFETCFYWSHTWLHTPSGYRFHKDHHAYYTPMSIAGFWGSLVEGILSQPVGFLPIFFLDMKPSTIILISLAHTTHSCYDHSGYNFPFDPFQLIPFSGFAEEHNFHHSHCVDNFGLYWRFWDDLMGTNKSWKKFESKKHQLMAKLKEGKPADDDEDYVIRNGVMLLRCVAEEQHIKEGTDNLSHTFQYTYKNVDDQGNIVDKPTETNTASGPALEPAAHCKGSKIS